ncbi:MAG: GNAT family N-acetyltransferase [Vicinamibacterales bacterium]
MPLDAQRHAAALYDETCGPDRDDLWTYLPDGPYTGRQPFDQDLAAKAQSSDPLFFAIVDRASGRALGVAAYLRLDPSNRVVEVGHILFGRGLQRTAAATEAMYLMARYVFEELGYRRYEWKCDTRNEPSRRAAERLGFTFEGVFRQHMIRKGQNRDSAWFSMLDGEWPANKQAFERWLDPANFDAAGKQRRTLGSLRLASADPLP